MGYLTDDNIMTDHNNFAPNFIHVYPLDPAKQYHDARFFMLDFENLVVAWHIQSLLVTNEETMKLVDSDFSSSVSHFLVAGEGNPYELESSGANHIWLVVHFLLDVTNQQMDLSLVNSFSFYAYRLAGSVNGRMQFVQNSVHGPLASIVVQQS